MISLFLLDFGGPATLNEVRPFLYNLFCDRAIFPLPFGQKTFATVISRLRSPRIEKQYAAIGGGSPLPTQARIIARALQENLGRANLDIQVSLGFRYTPPFIPDVLQEIAKSKPSGILLLPMFPQYSTATTLSVVAEFKAAFVRQRLEIPYETIDWWFDTPEFITAWCYSLTKALDTFPEAIRSEVPILFTAHGLPVSFVTQPFQHSGIRSLEFT